MKFYEMINGAMMEFLLESANLFLVFVINCCFSNERDLFVPGIRENITQQKAKIFPNYLLYKCHVDMSFKSYLLLN